ncbi:hypothetical protein [Micromonospora sp. NPDC005299]|uniref:hypothetical protein n=1 Tax=Micromonospora sp. NPDC005299 TaxID=3364231 RepID=UPI0036BD2975
MNNIRRTYLATSLADSEQVIDVATSALLTGAALVTGFLFRYNSATTTYYWLRCEFNPGATNVMLKITKCVGGSFTDLAVLNLVPSLTYAANTYLRVRASVVGTQLAMKVWSAAGAEPAGWQLTATDTAITAAGATGLQSWLVAGNTNTLPVTALHKNYALRVDLANRFIDQWEPTFLPIRPGESASAARITASGLLRRLDQGVKPARSAPARFIPTTSPVAYWPLEDGQLVTEGTAAVGGEPMRPFVGTHPSGAVVTFAQWGRGELAPWLPDALSRTGSHGLAIVWAPVRMGATSQWCVDFMYRSGTDASDSTVDVNPSYLPGGALGWPQLTLLPDLQGVDVSMNGESEVGGTASTLFDGQPHHVRWFVWQDGTKVSWGVYVDGVGVNGGSTTGNMTVPPVTSIALAAAAQAGADIAQGHLAVWASNPNHPACVAAAFGNPGEPAATRVARLCAEEGIPVSVLPGYSEPMGPQPTAGVMDLLREAEAADMGVLYELGYGLAYRPREARYNTPTAMTIDLATYAVSGRSDNVLEPTYDDQGLRNEWTVSRVNGASATALDAAHQQRSGVYDDSEELSVASDGVLADHASWRVRLGTVDELREDTFPLDLAANPALVDGWLSCGVGSRILRTNPPAQYGADPLDRLVEGWSETIGPRSWLVQVNPSPAAAWDVGVVDVSREGSDGSTLNSAIPNATWGSFEIKSTAWNGPWTTVAADFPMLVKVGGEVMRVSTIGGTGSVQTAIVSQRGVNGVARAWPAGTPVDVYQAAVVAL